MVTQIPIPSVPVGPTTVLAEARVVLHNISWETFERLLQEAGDHRNARFYYLDGTLEIMSPLFSHEGSNRFIERLIGTVAELMGVNLRRAGSATLQLKPQQVSAEPDSAYYIQNEPRVRHLNELDLQKDPPPDLGVEVDITSPSDRRFPIYARLGIPELWQFDGETIQYYELRNGEYVPTQISLALPMLPADVILQSLQKRLNIGETQAIREFKTWLQQVPPV
jgi:Uma2 family endonuclease